MHHQSLGISLGGISMNRSLRVIQLALVCIFAFCAKTQAAPGDDLLKAPPAFEHEGKHVIPVDFQKMDLSIVFDIQTKTAIGHSRIEFYAKETGYPMIDLLPEATSVRLDGVHLGQGALPEISSPQQISKFRMVNGEARGGAVHVLEIKYKMTPASVTFSSTGVKVGFWTTDLQDRGYLERYAPSNFEFDQFPMDLTLSVKGASAPHHLFTNGKIEHESDNRWNVSFPEYFDASSFFIHLTEAQVHVVSSEYQGIQARFPVTFYSQSETLPEQAWEDAKKVLAENEAAFGPFAHPRLVVYLTPGGGGMEYCGGTMTSSWALGHELTHSWFARGVMPSNGNAGWIDEAIASWRDNGYPTATELEEHSPVNLGGFSVYRRHTPMEAYHQGARLLSEFDRLFHENGGLRPVLAQLFTQQKHQTISTEFLKTFLEHVTGQNLKARFDRDVYGKGRPGLVIERDLRERLLPNAMPSEVGTWTTPSGSRHPLPYTEQELIEYR
jgi:hypothetical protein